MLALWESRWSVSRNTKNFCNCSESLKLYLMTSWLNFGTLLYNVIHIKKLSISMMEWHWKKWLLILHIISYLYCNHDCRWHSGKRIRLPIQEMQETRIPSLELGRSPGEGNGYPLQYSCLEDPMDRGAWSPWGYKESDTTQHTLFQTWLQ